MILQNIHNALNVKYHFCIVIVTVPGAVKGMNANVN